MSCIAHTKSTYSELSIQTKASPSCCSHFMKLFNLQFLLILQLFNVIFNDKIHKIHLLLSSNPANTLFSHILYLTLYLLFSSSWSQTFLIPSMSPS